MKTKVIGIFIIMLLIVSSIFPMPGLSVKGINSEIFLPPPLSVTMTYRDAIQSRCSVRTFHMNEPIEDDILSTVLWASIIHLCCFLKRICEIR